MAIKLHKGEGVVGFEKDVGIGGWASLFKIRPVGRIRNRCVNIVVGMWCIYHRRERRDGFLVCSHDRA